ncbi:MAG: hypothetical protein B7Z39_00525 [Novosphingobium sp. 12-64-8]|nr:MAG: hypothetical protein B7Z39_00525 [Novosphingobium sp. 12-64-8]
MAFRILLPLLAGAALTVSGCARNYAAEGGLAGAAGGALIGAATDGNVGRGAAIGAAAGGAVGALIKKDGRCYNRDRNGYEYEVRC